MASAPMIAARSLTNDQPIINAKPELAAQTFLFGVPVQWTGAGIKEWDGVTVAAGIAGVSNQPANNLTTTGTQQFVTLPGGVPNQSSAVKIARGAPYNDGRHYFAQSVSANVFFGQVGPSQTAVTADIGTNYGMTKDTDNHWFVDRTKVGAQAVVQVVALSDQDTTRGVFFVFLPAAQQLLG